jgi:nucleotide-binding universal stress UspA family protein
VRHTLGRWGILPKGSSEEEVAKIGLKVHKILCYNEDPVTSTLSHLRKYPADLIVLATNQRKGAARWLKRAIAEPIARRSGEMTLFVPKRSKGFISLSNGAIVLQRILIPIDSTPNPQPAIEAASNLARILGCRNISYLLLHVGEDRDMPVVHTPEQEGWNWDKTVRRGDVVEQIFQVAADFSADLIVMATQGHKDFLDVLRGSTTEQVIRGSYCPILALPAS